ncbi:hypothetical protein GCM10010462_14180 [Microbacterium dextranolyticum]|uniref:2-oxoglutarate dehydrogenase n=1 Tax=Microbacterium dextranolyticum TaxID=36806 RepID=A0A9W6HK33_9MICO|nr:hypothetical protein GCM10017591_07920 [Microbacterium dextranolyticum]
MTVLALLLMLVPVSAARGATPSPTPSPTGSPVLSLRVAPGAAGVITADQPVIVTVSAQNTSDTPAAAGAVRLSSSLRPLATRTEVQSWLAAAPTDASRTEVPVGAGELAAVAPQQTSGTSITVDPAVFAGRAPGVYPLRADYDATGGALSAASVVIVPSSPGTGALGVVVPIVATPSGSGLLTAAELSELTATDGELRKLLDAVTGTSAILAIDPAVVAAVRVLGTTAPATAKTWLADLMALPNSRFALQFGDADVAVQVAAGLPLPLDVPSLTPYLVSSGFAGASEAPTPTPTSTTDTPTAPTPMPTSSASGAVTLPTLTQLTDIGSTAATVFWPATGTAGSETVAALSGLSTDGGPPITLVDSGAYGDDAADRTVGDSAPAWTSVGGARVLLADAGASRALTVAATTPTPIARAGALAEANAYGALALAAHPGAPLLVTLDRTIAASPEGVRIALSSASRLGGRTATDLSTLTSGAPSEVALKPAAVATERVGGLDALLGDERTLADFATILADPTVLTVPERAAMLHVIGAGWNATPDLAAQALGAHRTATQETLASVAIVPPSDITLAATSAPLAFSVRNDLRWPVTLQLIATVTDPRMIVQNTTAVDAGAAQNTRVQVPVQARVGSGESSLHLQLRSPQGVAIGGPVAVHVAVRAEWESVGVTVMVALVAAMIVLGIVRTLRKIRRRKES